MTLPKILFPLILFSGLNISNDPHDVKGIAEPAPSFPCAEENIPKYKAYKATSRILVDGKLDEASWSTLPQSEPFRDLVHGTATRYDTRAAVTWDDEYLYVGYWIEEPNVKATLTVQDAPIYRDNDVELFIAGRDGYYELEINAYSTIYEVLFLWEEAYRTLGYDTLPEFDRSKPKVRNFNGVGFKTHPRGKRIGYWNWDYPGLKRAVHVEGTLNDDKDVDTKWTVELALPWKGLDALMRAEGRALPPKSGDVWRMDFSRFNTYKDGPDDSGGWAWSPHGVWDSHVPECFTFVEFVRR